MLGKLINSVDLLSKKIFDILDYGLRLCFTGGRL